jgi:cytochrome c biogenesis protein CcmG/thiol:disulfide interchange protein DsbE
MVLGLGALIVLPLLVLFARSFGNDPHAVPSVLEQKPAPSFALTDLDGQPWSSASLVGKPYVLNFWSTWCGPCKQEHQVLQAAAKAHPEVQFLGVIYSDEPDACRRYLEKAGTTYDHLVDAAGRVAIDYGVAGVPETFFVSADGTIVHKQVGPVTGPILESLLARIAPR